MSQMVLDVTPELQEKVNFWSERVQEAPNVLVLHAIENYIGDLECDDDEPPLTEEELEDIRIADQEFREGKGIPFAEVLRELW